MKTILVGGMVAATLISGLLAQSEAELENKRQAEYYAQQAELAKQRVIAAEQARIAAEQAERTSGRFTSAEAVRREVERRRAAGQVPYPNASDEALLTDEARRMRQELQRIRIQQQQAAFAAQRRAEERQRHMDMQRSLDAARRDAARRR